MQYTILRAGFGDSKTTWDLRGAEAKLVDEKTRGRLVAWCCLAVSPAVWMIYMSMVYQSISIYYLYDLMQLSNLLVVHWAIGMQMDGENWHEQHNAGCGWSILQMLARLWDLFKWIAVIRFAFFKIWIGSSLSRCTKFGAVNRDHWPIMSDYLSTGGVRAPEILVDTGRRTSSTPVPKDELFLEGYGRQFGEKLDLSKSRWYVDMVLWNR